jgi:hypothetical protein
MPRYLVQLLGPPLIVDTRSGAIIDFPAGKTLALLTYLVVNNAPPLRDQLYHLLWADSPRDRGLQSVRQALWLIRHTFGEAALSGRDGTAHDRELIGSASPCSRGNRAGRIDERGEDRSWPAAGAPMGPGGETRLLEHRPAFIDFPLPGSAAGSEPASKHAAARGTAARPSVCAAFADPDARQAFLRDRVPWVAGPRAPRFGRRGAQRCDRSPLEPGAPRATQRVVVHGRSGIGKTRRGAGGCEQE